MCRLESNANVTQKLITHKLMDDLSTKSQLKISKNSVLDAQTNDEDTNDLEVKSKNNEVFHEKEILCPVNKNVKCYREKEKSCKKPIEDKQKYFNQPTNLQEKSTHGKNAYISINCEKQERFKDEHVSTVNEIMKDSTENEKIIFEKECTNGSTYNEKIQNLNQCFTKNKLCTNKLDEQKCTNTNKNHKEHLLDSKINKTSITNKKLIEIHGGKQVEGKLTPDDVENDACNDDQDDEEIIFYYINSGII